MTEIINKRDEEELLKQVDWFFRQDRRTASPLNVPNEVLDLSYAISLLTRRDLTLGDVYIELRLRYSSSKGFFDAFSFLYENKNYSPIVADVRKRFFKLCNIMIDCEKAIKADTTGKALNRELISYSNNHYGNNKKEKEEKLKKAVQVIGDYIESDSVDIGDFLRKEEITRNEEITMTDFNTYRVLVLVFDRKLFREYEKKAIQNKEARIATAKKRVEKLKKIASSAASRSVDLTDAMFLANLPNPSNELLYDLSLSPEILDRKNLDKIATKFLREEPDELRRKVSNLFIRNISKAGGKYAIKPGVLRTNERMELNYSINGKTLSDKDKGRIIDYMKKRKMPPLTRSFIILCRTYLNGELHLPYRLVDRNP